MKASEAEELCRRLFHRDNLDAKPPKQLVYADGPDTVHIRHGAAGDFTIFINGIVFYATGDSCCGLPIEFKNLLLQLRRSQILDDIAKL